MSKHSILEYCYRDASNYRVHEWILLSGSLSSSGEARLRAALIDGSSFVAEAVGLHSLRPELEEISGGATSDDHDWHELVSVRPAIPAEVDRLPVRTSVDEQIRRFEIAQSSGHAGI